MDIATLKEGLGALIDAHADDCEFTFLIGEKGGLLVTYKGLITDGEAELTATGGEVTYDSR